MFERILVPLDLTDKHRSALDFAKKLAQQSGGQVTLLHVIEVIPGLDVDEEKKFYYRLERAARKHLEQFARRLTQQKINCQAEILFGGRAAMIARYAADIKASLIVLTAPRLDPDHPAASLGSLSYKVGLLARCPVLLVK